MGKYEAHSPVALAMNPLISKARKPKFELHLKIYDLINVPLVTGTSFVKWHVPSSTANEHRGRTNRAPIKAHKVVWKYERIIQLRLVIDKNNNLQDCLINFEVIQDCSTPSKIDKIILGKIELNLAEYADESEFGSDDDDSFLRRYLMQDSKINSTLKIGIWMKQVDGERNYKAPPLKTATVFRGITGIVAGEQEGNEDVCHIPTTSRPRDQGEIQDLYRQILAASWASYDGELAADECIDNIFNGVEWWHYEKVKNDDLENSSNNVRKSNFSRHRRSPYTADMKSGEEVSPRAVSYNLPENCNMSENLSFTGKGTYRELVDEELDASRFKIQNLHDSDESTEKDDLIAWKIWQDSET